MGLIQPDTAANNANRRHQNSRMTWKSFVCCIYVQRNFRIFPSGTVSKVMCQHKSVLKSRAFATKSNEQLTQNLPLCLTKLTGEFSGITVLTLNRPEVRNAINFSLLNQLERTLSAFRNEGAPDVLILRSGYKGVFCAGADLKERLQLSDHEYWRWSLTIRHLTQQFSDLPSASIAAMDGTALGGGLELALMCDLCIAASNVNVGLPETGLGIIPGAGGTQRLPRLIGASRAKELVFTGRRVGAQEALKLGLVNHVVPQNTDGDAAYRRTQELAKEIMDEKSGRREEGESFQLKLRAWKGFLKDA